MLSCVIDPAGARSGGKRQNLTDPERRALKVLRDLVGDIRDNSGQLPRVPVGTWRDAFRDREDGAFDSRKKRAARATKSLIDKGFVDVGYDLVWLVEADQ